MRYPPTDDYDKKELERLNVEPWMVELLKLNPGYVNWGPHEDYMWKQGQGWDCAVLKKDWKDFGPWDLDDLNEVAHFYFFLGRESKECDKCSGSGYAPDAYRLHQTFYRFWSEELTEDEVAALIEHQRVQGSFPELYQFVPGVGQVLKEGCKHPSAAEVNRRMGSHPLGHDAINASICVEARCKRCGYTLTCEQCEGHGHVYTEPKGTVGLTLWFLHPRKGCSRGVEIKSLTQEDLPAVYAFLREAAQRNAERFSKIPAAP